MQGYSFDLTCPGCGSELVHLAGGSRHVWQQAAMARCSGCSRKVLVNVDVSFAEEEKPIVQERRIHNARTEILDGEHDSAMARSRRELATA